MPIIERDYMRRGGEKHPAACTCAECTEARLGRQQKKRLFNLRLSLQNLPHPLKKNKLKPKSKGEKTKQGDIATEVVPKQLESLRHQQNAEKEYSKCQKCKRWTLWFNVYEGIFECQNPKCGATGRSTRNLRYNSSTYKYKKLGWDIALIAKRLVPKSLIKLVLNLLILAGLALLIEHSYQLFTAHPEEPLKESIILIFGLALWITTIKLSKSRSRHYWLRYNGARPSFKLTTFAVILILLILTFAGVQPMSTYKDNLFNKLSTYWETQTAETEEIITETIPPSESSTISPETETPTVVTPTEIPPKNPSWEELKTFLYNDTTDQLEYIFPIFVCENFARTLQENAKEAGWRCALVSVKLEGYPDWFNYGIPSNTGHSLNAFETTDRGLVYIDCTQTAQSGFSGNADKLVNVEIGKEYIPVSIFPTPGWSPEWLSMGTVMEIEFVKW